jgi:hypothetical protein
LPVKRPGWSKATRDWWKAIWASPMATQWRADDAELVRAALLWECVWSGEFSAALLAELRAIEDRHGLSPLARLKLRWSIEDDSDALTGSDATVTSITARARNGMSAKERAAAARDPYADLK